MPPPPPLTALAAALLASTLGLAVAAAGPKPKPKAGKRPRPGKVVRVERNLPQLTSAARVCTLFDIDVGTCARELVAGEVGLVLDGEGMYGEATVLDANRVVDSCGNAVAWNITIDMSRLTSRDYSYNAILLLGHPVAEDGHTLPPMDSAPAGRPGEFVSQVVDDDGDGQGDLMISSYPCDEHGRPTTAPRTAQTCTDTWLEVRDEWRHARTDRVPLCHR